MTTLFAALQPQGGDQAQVGLTEWLAAVLRPLAFYHPGPFVKGEGGGGEEAASGTHPPCAHITDTQHRQTNYSCGLSMSAFGAWFANSQLFPSCGLRNTIPVAPRLRSQGSPAGHRLPSFASID